MHVKEGAATMTIVRHFHREFVKAIRDGNVAVFASTVVTISY